MLVVYGISVFERMGGDRIESGGILIYINDNNIYYDDVEFIWDVFQRMGCEFGEFIDLVLEGIVVGEIGLQVVENGVLFSFFELF